MAIERPNSVPWPPIILVGCLFAGFLAQYAYPLYWPSSPISDFLFALGFLMAAAAVAIDVLAIRTLHANATTVLPNKAADKLVTSGPFALSRNPIYVANVMLIAGIGLVFGNLWLLVLAIIDGILTNRLAVLREERHLAAKFGKQWRDYTKKVRRWI